MYKTNNFMKEEKQEEKGKIMYDPIYMSCWCYQPSVHSKHLAPTYFLSSFSKETFLCSVVVNQPTAQLLN